MLELCPLSILLKVALFKLLTISKGLTFVALVTKNSQLTHKLYSI